MIRLIGVWFVITVILGCQRESAEGKKEPSRPLVEVEAKLESNAKTEATVRAVIADLFSLAPTEIDLKKPLSAPPLRADELDLVELVMELEDRFKIEIPDSVVEKYGGGRLGTSSFSLSPNQLIRIVEECKMRTPKKGR